MNTKLEINALKTQISTLENTLAQILALVNNLASTKSLSNLSALINADMEDIETRLTAVEAQTTSHEARITTLET
jgi:chaperonin cofactor prefoldin